MSISEKKMSGAQDTVGAFNLDAFVRGADQEEATEAAPKLENTKKRLNPSDEVQRPATVVKPTSLKIKKEPLSVRVQVRMTQAEFEKLEGKMGLVPISTFLRKFLKDNGLI